MPDSALGSTASFGVIESPRDNLWPIPEAGPELFGHCLLLRLDTVACVAALEDQDAMCAASLVPREWFLGITLPNNEGRLYDSEGEPFLGFKFCFVRSGLPELEHASMPSAPTKCATGRPPSLTINALPWEDLHVHTHRPMAAVVSRLHYTAGQRVARLDASTLEKVVHLHRATALPVDWKKDQRLETSASAQENQVDVPNAHNEEDGNSQRALPERVQDRLARLRIFVEVWLDPAAHPGPLADPAKFREATSRVQEIWRDWQARMLTETGSYDAPIDAVAGAQEPTQIVLAEEGIQPAETLLTMPTASGCPESIRPSSDISQPRLNPESLPSARKLPLVSLRLRGALSKLRARFGRAQARAMP